MKFTDKERLDVLLGVIRGGRIVVPASWVNQRGQLTVLNIKNREDIDICVRAIRASRRKKRAEIKK